jgi:hypothetical protein
VNPLAINGLVLALTAGLSFGSAALRPPAPVTPVSQACPSVAACTFSTSSATFGHRDPAIDAWNSLSNRLSLSSSLSLSQTVTLSLSKRASHMPVVAYAGNTDSAASRQARPSATLELTDPQPAYGSFRTAYRARATSDRNVATLPRSTRTAYGAFPDF